MDAYRVKIYALNYIDVDYIIHNTFIEHLKMNVTIKLKIEFYSKLNYAMIFFRELCNDNTSKVGLI